VSQSTLLLLLFFLPFAGAFFALIAPIKQLKAFKAWALLMSLIPLLLLVFGHHQWIGSSVNYSWIPTLAIRFHLSVDSLSLIFLYLTALFVPLSILSIGSHRVHQPNLYYGLILLLEAFLIAFFTARDLALFTIFWEAMLVPLYFIISLWGKSERQNAALKFFIYMVAGSVFMVAAVLALYFHASQVASPTFNMDALASALSAHPLPWVGAVFLLAFSIKTPLFPFHGWLPDAYCQAPTSGTILLSTLLSKAGIYGILRIGMELFPSLIEDWSPFFLGFAIAGTLYAACVAFMQTDYKRLIAYSSISHVNFILAGLFVWNFTSHTGGLLQAVNHSITIGALFLVSEWLEERLKTTDMAHTGGLARYFPKLCWITLVFVFASVALPGTNNFVGELLIFFGLFTYSPWLMALLGLNVIIAAAYMLGWMQKVYFGMPVFRKPEWKDIGLKEVFIACPLIAMIFIIGIYPEPVLEYVKSSIKIVEKS